jgi:membrane protein
MAREVLREYQNDRVTKLAASLSYLTVFALAPLLLISIAVAGSVIGHDIARERIIGEIAALIGPEGASLVGTMVENVSADRHGPIATVIGLLTLFLTSAAAFVDLQDSLNLIWGVKTKAKGSALVRLIERRLVSFGFVLVTGFLLLVSLIVSALITAIGDYMGETLTLSGQILQIANFVVSLLIVFGLFSLMYRVLPDVRLTWKEVRVGAIATTVLFVLGKSLIGFYLGRSATASIFGAAGSLAVLLLWMYYSALVFFLGAEFTYVYVRRFGSGVRPAEDAHQLKRPVDAFARP